MKNIMIDVYKYKQFISCDFFPNYGTYKSNNYNIIGLHIFIYTKYHIPKNLCLKIDNHKQ